jgi:hypothetical protein
MTYWVHSAPDDVALGEGQRPCARGEHCAARTAETINGERVVTPAATYQPLCRTDRGLVEAALDELPERYLELAFMLGSKTRSDGPRVSGSRSAPIPLRMDVDELMVKVVSVISSWDERVRDIPQLKLSGPDTEASRHRRGEVALTRMCATLTKHLDALLALPAGPMVRYVPLTAALDLDDDTEGRARPAGYAELLADLSGADAGLEILALERDCRHMIGWTARHVRLPVPCDRCDSIALVQWDGATGLEEGAYCTSCGYEYTDNEYVLLRSRVYEDEVARQNEEAS